VKFSFTEIVFISLKILYCIDEKENEDHAMWNGLFDWHDYRDRNGNRRGIRKAG